MSRLPQVIRLTSRRKKAQINWRKITFVVIATLVLLSMVLVELTYLLEYARK
jgi:hypothetical protein